MSNGYDAFFKAAKTARADKPLKSAVDVGEEQLRQRMRVRKSRRPVAEFNWPLMIVLGVFCGLLGWWTIDPSLPEHILGKIEFKMFGQALAKDAVPAKSEGTKGQVREESAGLAVDSKKAVVGGSSPEVDEELSHFKKLRERKEALDLRERELNELEEELHKQKGEVEARIQKLETLRSQIAAILKERVEVDQEKVNKLVETYSNMKPKQAAEILGGIDEDLAVEILGKMKKKNAAEILNLIESVKARSLSEKFAGYKRR